MVKTFKVAIAGLGVVGLKTLKLIEQNKEIIQKRAGANIDVVAVSARDLTKDRGIDLSPYKKYENALDFVSEDDLDVVIEVIGGDEGIAYELCKSSLESAKHVVTANKALLAKHGYELGKIAEENNVNLLFEPAVAAGIPVISALKDGLAANNIKVISGILNGTCNYIISRMQDTSSDFDSALNLAQELGYAEADPSFDIDGIDASHKLAVLSSIAYGTKIDHDSVYTEGIRELSLSDINFTRALGFVVKLLCVSKIDNNGFLEQRVHLCLVPKGYPLSNIEGVDNAVYFNGDFVGDVVFKGPGAGGSATASSVVSDLVTIASGNVSKPFGISYKDQKELKPFSMDDYIGEYYIRIDVRDESGALADITNVLKQEQISIESILQKTSTSEQKKAHIVGVVYEVREKNLLNAIEKISKLEKVIGDPVFIRVER